MLHIEPKFFLTGILLVTSGSALAKAGPAPILIFYTIVGLIVHLVMCAFGEIAT